MISCSKTRFIRMSSKKMRLVVDKVRGKSVREVFESLPNVNKKACVYVSEAVRSAYSNARVKFPESNYTEDVLYISKITADEGPRMKRFRAASMGRASAILHRTTHLNVELDVIPEKIAEMEAKKEKKEKKPKLSAGKSADRKTKKAAVAKGSK